MTSGPLLTFPEVFTVSTCRPSSQNTVEIKALVFWIVTPCSFISRNQHFLGSLLFPCSRWKYVGSGMGLVVWVCYERAVVRCKEKGFKEVGCPSQSEDTDKRLTV
jgi:hypothetical protein